MTITDILTLRKQGRLKINTKKYIEQNIKIKTKESKLVPLVFNKPQQKLYNAIKAQRQQGKPIRVIILKARQMGFSTLTEAIIFKNTTTKRNIKSGIVAHLETATANLFKMSKLMYEELPQFWKPSLRASNAQELVFDDKQGRGLRSTIKCMTAGGNGIGRSDTFQNLHISEYAFWTGDKKNTLTGLVQAVPNTPDSMIIIESTANGFDDFKERWDAAVRGESDYLPVFCAWWELSEYAMPSTLTQSDLDEEEKQLVKNYNLTLEQLEWRRWCIKNNCQGDIELFHQEYPSNPHEAFISTGQSVFDKQQVIERLEQNIKPLFSGHFEYKEENDGQLTNIKLIKQDKDIINFYEDTEEGYPYVLGGDTAGDGSDYFTGHVLNNNTAKQAAVLRHKTDEDLYAKQMYCLGMYYNKALIGIEVNFSTYPQKTLERLDYPNFYVREVYDSAVNAYQKKYGFRTDSKTRPLMIANLVAFVRDNIDCIQDKETLTEMLTFIKTDKGKAEAMPGKHDDNVMGLAIAHMIRSQQSCEVNIKKQDNKFKLSDNFNVSSKKTELEEYQEW